jgi:DNA-binding beta-propeller fold protein YncE
MTREFSFLSGAPAKLLAAILLWPALTLAQSPDFITFESGHVRPLVMSADGTRLFAVNTPNNMLEVFTITSTGLTLQSRIPVGLEPVAVALRSPTEAWVVNHLSDSVSIVTLTGTPRVTRTLLVGDEPRDIVFAGTNNNAFITTAHRGQHRTHSSIAGVPGAGDPQLVTPGVSRADVWVFNPASLGSTIGGTPLRIVTLFGDTPRGLAVSPDRRTVYAAIMQSGNQTTTANLEAVCDGFLEFIPCFVLPDRAPLFNNIFPGGLPGPGTNVEGKRAPEVGLVVKWNRSRNRWEDTLGRNWNNAIRFRLPDKDVFAINADTLAQTAFYTGVGTTLFNMVTNPVSGRLYVTNSEAQNLTRFEGPGVFGGSTVQGNLAQMRVTVISGSTVTPRHLNKHIDYSVLANEPGFDPTIKNHSLSTPLDMVVSSNGARLYVAAFGSSKVGVFDTAALENNSFNPRTASANYINVTGGGPSGLALDEARNRLYVMTRFDNSVKVINLATRAQIASAVLPNPEPASVVQGRRFLYDAAFSSANGEASCASCHIFGDKDELAWDLGNPDDLVTSNPIPARLASGLEIGLFQLVTGFPGITAPINGTGNPAEFHPMKGPMTTQTLRGLVNAGAMHWRGDRANGFFGVDTRTEPPFDANLSFNNFIVAFEGLLGRASMPTPQDMQRFTDFQLQVQLPPNPIRNLDNSLTPAQAAGAAFYFGPRRSDGIAIGADTGFNCNGCHVVDSAKGFFGTDGRASFEGITQIFKIPHLRNIYTKIGMFGFPDSRFFDVAESGNMGDQVRGFGLTNDGVVDTVDRFLSAIVFRNNLLGPGVGIPNAQTRRDLEQFVLAFDTDLAPIVGQQVTLNNINGPVVNPRIDLLIARARAPFASQILGGSVTECDLVAKVATGGRVRGYFYEVSSGMWSSDDGSPAIADSQLRALAATAGQEVTFTAVPPGSGRRIANTR